jgi:hypothetical protein
VLIVTSIRWRIVGRSVLSSAIAPPPYDCAG